MRHFQVDSRHSRPCRTITLSLTIKMHRNSSGFTFIAATVAINAASLFLCLTATAAKAPRSVEDLAKNSDAIVVGSIEHLRIESAPSRMEPGFGNSDWVIILTLGVENVESGNLVESNIEARCIRVRSRRSLGGLIGLAGHRPIPGKDPAFESILRTTKVHGLLSCQMA